MLTAQTVRKHNLLGLMQMLRNKDILSNKEITDMTGLPSSSVCNFMDELCHAGIVSNTGFQRGLVGRPAQRYVFNADTRYVFGVLLSFEYFEVVLYDLSYTCITMQKRPVAVKFISAEDTISTITGAIKEIMEEYLISRKFVAGVGFNIPGPVDSGNGIVLELAHLQQWTSVPLRDIVEEQLEVTAFVEKDACASALGMKWYAGVPEDSTLAYLSFIEGLGLSLLINNHIYRGQNRMMGELGHISIDKNGPLCSCGDCGCLELYASDFSMMERIVARVDNERTGLMWSECNGDARSITLNMVKKAALKHDPIAVSEMNYTADHIAVSIVSTIKLFDPNIVMLGHSWLKEFPAVFRRIVTEVYESYFFAQNSTVQIELCNVKRISLIGAAAIVFENEFDDMRNSSLLKAVDMEGGVAGGKNTAFERAN